MDYTNFFDKTGLKSPYYRVSVKAIVRDNKNRILVCADDTGTFELPGGGWEHGESFNQALRREFAEEMGVQLTSVGNLLFAYYGRGTYKGQVRPCLMLRIVAETQLESHHFVLDKDEVTKIRFVDRKEFLALNWCDTDTDIVKYADKIWPPVEKNSQKR